MICCYDLGILTWSLDVNCFCLVCCQIVNSSAFAIMGCLQHSRPIWIVYDYVITPFPDNPYFMNALVLVILSVMDKAVL
jgi:hypothetical protein